MCSRNKMKKYPGDLIDMIRTTGDDEEPETDGNFPMNFPVNPDDYLGDPFTLSKDPLLYDLVSGFLMSSSVNNRSSLDDLSPLINPTGGSTPSEKLPVVIVPPAANSGISSPQNPGTQRRKSQTKKVVCIPAPAPPAKNRPGAETVPSDLWAWRKYGQKPIKGSPYPRGYYKCSSSKGCSARKQVERSRTDPNMLVITYTAEHNHPWPTHQNSLAGSTRWKTKSPQDLKEPPQAIKEEHDHTKIDLEGFPQFHKPTLTYSSQFEDNLLADFDESQTVSMDALFDGFEKRPFDPFSLCDWNESGGATTSTSVQNKSSSNDLCSALDQMHNIY